MTDKTWNHLVSHNEGKGLKVDFHLVHFHRDEAGSIIMHVACPPMSGNSSHYYVKFKVECFLAKYDEYTMEYIGIFDRQEDLKTYEVRLRRNNNV